MIKKTISLIIIIFSLTFSTTILANFAETLTNLIRRDDIADMEKFLKNKTNLKGKIDKLHELPSQRIAKSLLKHLDPNHFLRLILHTNIEIIHHDRKTNLRMHKIDGKLVKKRNSLVDLGLKKGGDADKLLLEIMAINMQLIEKYRPILEKKGFNEKDLNEKERNEINKIRMEHKLSRLSPITLPRADDIIEISLQNGANPRKITHFNKFPSMKIADLLLEHKKYPVSPTSFIKIIQMIPTQNINSKTYDFENEDDEILLAKKRALIELAEKKLKNSNNEKHSNLPTDDHLDQEYSFHNNNFDPTTSSLKKKNKIYYYYNEKTKMLLQITVTLKNKKDEEFNPETITFFYPDFRRYL